MADGSASPERSWGLRGLWQYLIARINARTEVLKAGIALQKERERNRAAATYLEQLPAGAQLADYEDGSGRKIWISKCGFPVATALRQPATVVILVAQSATPPTSAKNGSRPSGELP